jgi:hypothetical protein
MLKWFASCGFKTNPLTKICRSVDELLAFHRQIEARREAITTSTAWSTRWTGSTGNSGWFRLAQSTLGERAQVRGREWPLPSCAISKFR